MANRVSSPWSTWDRAALPGGSTTKGHFISGGGLFGLLPTSILGDIGDSLPRASARYIYTVSVPNPYHTLGREGVQSLREEVGCERAQEWEQAMQARRDAEAARAA